MITRPIYLEPEPVRQIDRFGYGRRLTNQGARYLLATLETQSLKVSLIPAPDPRHATHKIRAVSERNPQWYRRLCAAYPTKRAKRRLRRPEYSDTLIRRKSVLRALDEISRGRRSGTYVERLLPICKAAADWLAQDKPEKEVFEYIPVITG